MFDSILLTLSLAVGQAGPGLPVAASPTPVIIPHYQPAPVIGRSAVLQNGTPAQLPMVVPPPMPNGAAPVYSPAPAPVYSEPYNPVALEEEAKEEGDEEADDQYAFMKAISGTRAGNWMEENSISISGWVGTSYNVSTASKSNAPVFMIDQANEFLLNQNWLHFTKAIDPTKKEFQLGFTNDWILPGSDARTTLPRGLWNSQLTDLNENGFPTLYPIDPFQFYLEAFLPGLGEGTTVKVGRFATPIGYELVQQPDTPFVSRSYLFQYNPFTHTGVFASTALNDCLSVGYGAVTGNDTFIDPANQLTGLFQVRWAPPEGKTTATLNASITDPTFDVVENFAFYNCYNAVITRSVSDNLTYVLDTAFSHINGVPNIGSTNWYGAANYFIYTVSDNVTATLRAEVFEDTDGFRTGFEGLYTEGTFGVAWSPVQALIIRPSVRYDYNCDSNPFEGDNDLWTAAIEGIIRW